LNIRKERSPVWGYNRADVSKEKRGRRSTSGKLTREKRSTKEPCGKGHVCQRKRRTEGGGGGTCPKKLRVGNREGGLWEGKPACKPKKKNGKEREEGGPFSVRERRPRRENHG